MTISLSLLSFNPHAYPQKIIQKIIARVNGKMITQFDLINYQKNIKILSNKNYPKQQILDFLIDLEIISQIAKEYSLEISPEELANTIKNYKNNITYQQNSDQLSSVNHEFLKLQLKYSLFSNKLIRYIINNYLIQNPKNSEIKQLYQEQKSQLIQQKKVKISHIIIQITQKDQEDYYKIIAKENIAKKILQLIRNKEDTFENLAVKYSDDLNSKYKLGLIGWYNQEKLSQINSEYGEIAFNLDVGQVSDLIWTKNGIHLIKILDKKKSKQLSYQEAKNYLKNKILQERAFKQLEHWKKNKKKMSTIQIYSQ